MWRVPGSVAGPQPPASGGAVASGSAITPQALGAHQTRKELRLTAGLSLDYPAPALVVRRKILQQQLSVPFILLLPSCHHRHDVKREVLR